MPTNFPTSVDNFTNPTANDSLNLPSHSTQHANANDAIEAVEDYLLNGRPAFSVSQTSGQSFPNTTFTKVIWDTTKNFDTNNCFDAVTNERFTPTVAGYYQLNGNLSFAGASVGASQINIYKNGVAVASGSGILNNTQIGGAVSISALIFLNGTTDYVELWGWQNSGGSLALQTGGVANQFSGFLAR
jgi:hypothetical protein